MSARDNDRQPSGRIVDPVASVPLGRGLSAKLLVLTAVFVLIAETLIFPPSAANFRLRWAEDKLNTAAVAGLFLMGGHSEETAEALREDILSATGALRIAVREDGMSRMLVSAGTVPMVDEHIDVSAPIDPFGSIRAALSTLVWGGDRMLRIHGKVGATAQDFEIVLPDRGLRDELLVYTGNIVMLSLFISVLTAVLVFAVINRVMIRPVRSMTRSMLAFAAEPDNPARIIRPENRRDELGIATRELAAMQSELQKTLGERKRLADLGLAVSKINHDMRNILGAAQLMSDRLTTATDPKIQSFAPRLVRTLDRAVTYSQSVLEYGRAQEAPPVRRKVLLRQLVDDVQAILPVDGGAAIVFENGVDAALEVDCDAEQMFRVLSNLCRNAMQALTGDLDAAIVKRLSVSARREGAVVIISIVDTGPGLPKKARDNLFAAFRGSARSGGTGLGLAIALELVRAHGGTLELVESRGGHTEFAITIPDQPVDLERLRGQQRRHAG